MNREQMVQKIADTLARPPFGATEQDDAAAVLDAILPQVTTVEELEALPEGSWVMSAVGEPILVWPKKARAEWVLMNFTAPFTVVWQP